MKRTQVFISYSHRDKKWLEELQITLKPDVRDHRLDVWDDTTIPKGAKWREEIKKALDKASVAVLLVSRYFFASDFIADNELPDLLDAAEKEGLVILWVSVSASSYEGTRIAAYQSVNDPSKPLDTLTTARRSRAFVEIVKGIERAFERAKEPEAKEKEEAGRSESGSGSPFPGLRAFTDKDAPIFFGREGEIDDLTDRINRNRFVTVVGASGSGKSSLVGAGLIPRLAANGIRSAHTASGDWLWLRLTPGGVGDNPFMALAVKLEPYLPGLEARDIAKKLEADPKALTQLIPQVLRGKPDSSELLLFIDQLEELVTMVRASYRAPFAEMLCQAVAGKRFRAVATLRADFYHQMIPISDSLVKLLQNGSYPLGVPDEVSLNEMIVRPAERAGLQFEGNLARRILHDTGREPGALALMAYLLDELYRCRAAADGRLTLQAYEDLGRVGGAIGKRAEQTFSALSGEAQAALPQVFLRLVEVNDQGTATRQRALRVDLERSAPAEELLKDFIKARLLVTDKHGENPTVEVAHEALLRKWGRLADWIEQTQDDLRLLRQVKLAAAEWDRNARQDAFRWVDERLQPVYEMIHRLEVDEAREFTPMEREFIRREFDRLLEVIKDPDTPHIRRSSIGERLCVIRDTRPGVGLRPDGLPDIDWCKVESADGRSSVEVEIENVGKVEVDLPFYIARYPVTYSQFQAFVEAPDGYHNRERNWFEGLPADDRDEQVDEQRFKFPNHPREEVNWHEAMAFCRWLSWRLGALKDSPSGSERKASSLMNPSTWLSRTRAGKTGGFDLLNPFTWAVRLPTEAEWQFAAAGPSAKTYPWGNDWDGRFANTEESGLSRTTAVGMYPAGAAACGALDMSGDVWEWTLTDYKSGKSTDITGTATRVVRGGSWFNNQYNARAAFRHYLVPVSRNSSFGFRVVGVVPSP
jgi:formylglycine-generating enzyme required for sulfatase activity/energy-coupling factor transporter ATP-binding protein EcfA2